MAPSYTAPHPVRVAHVTPKGTGFNVEKDVRGMARTEIKRE